MEYFNYADVKRFIYDRELQELLCVDKEFSDLFSTFLKRDFLIIDETLKIPFFAEIRDYVGARERDNPESIWIVKPIKEKEIHQTEMAMICFFIDFYSHTISAPSIITNIHNRLYKATKLITKAEQLSGAHYTELNQLKEQLLLDIINRWIYFDEDRNPNNYMIKYNSRNDQIVIAIDFQNVDLISSDMKIKGTPNTFGWERTQKTRYLTPLKSENCLEYEMSFYDMRFRHFNKLTHDFLKQLFNQILQYSPEREKLCSLIADNLIRRIEYVYNYFSSKIPFQKQTLKDEKYKDMGKTFRKIYDAKEGL